MLKMATFSIFKIIQENLSTTHLFSYNNHTLSICEYTEEKMRNFGVFNLIFVFPQVSFEQRVFKLTDFTPDLLFFDSQAGRSSVNFVSATLSH